MEDETYRNYADDFHLPMEGKLDYIIGEDEKGKFVKFEKDGAQATIHTFTSAILCLYTKQSCAEGYFAAKK